MKTVLDQVHDLKRQMEELQAIVSDQQKSLADLTRCVKRLSWPQPIRPAPNIINMPLEQAGILGKVRDLLSGKKPEEVSMGQPAGLQEVRREKMDEKSPGLNSPSSRLGT